MPFFALLDSLKKCDFLNRGYLYSDCAYPSSRHPFEIKLLEELSWQEFSLCIKLKFVDALFYYPNYRIFPKFSGRQVWANSADPDQTAPLIRVYIVCNSLCIFWMHYSKETPSCSTFIEITTNVLGVRIFRKFMVAAKI